MGRKPPVSYSWILKALISTAACIGLSVWILSGMTGKPVTNKLTETSMAVSVPKENGHDSEETLKIIEDSSEKKENQTDKGTKLSSYAREQLNDTGKTVYDMINEAVLQGETEINGDFQGVDRDGLATVYQYLLVDHPEYTWLDGSATAQSVNNTITKMTLHTIDISVTSAKMISRVEKKATAILKEAEKQKSDYAKALFIHDYLVETIDYDTDVFNRADDEEADVEDTIAGTVYGALVNEKAVCSGYAKTYQYLLERLGIPCTYISGTVEEGPHAWNLVMLGGSYYYVDVTWDDPVFESKEADSSLNMVEHTFFCVTTEMLTRTHRISELMAVPQCTKEKYNYYVYNQCYVKTYDFQILRQMIEKSYAKGENASIRFRTKDQLDQAVMDLLDQEGIFQIRGDMGLGGNVWHREDDENYILTIEY